MRRIDQDLSPLGGSYEFMNVDEAYRRPFLMAGQEVLVREALE